MEENNLNLEKVENQEQNYKKIDSEIKEQENEINETEKEEEKKEIKEAKEVVQKSEIEENPENMEKGEDEDNNLDQGIINGVCGDVLDEVIQKVENDINIENEDNLDKFENQKKEENLEIEEDINEKVENAEKNKKMEIEEKIELVEKNEKNENEEKIEKNENEEKIEKVQIVDENDNKIVEKIELIKKQEPEEIILEKPVAEIKKIERPEEVQKMEIEKIEVDPETQNRVFCFGNAESDQFKISDSLYEIKKPMEIPYFLSEKQKIVKIACGAQHSVILNENGEVFTFGNNDSGALGRDTEDGTIPGKVELDNNKVNLISAGESHTFLANSLTGTTVFFGKLKSYEKTLFKQKEPLITDNYKFKKGISKILSGNNHILVLSHGRVYGFGDESFGALGIVNKRRPKSFVDFDDPQTLAVRGVKNIFVTGNSSFFLNKKNKINAFGLNNHKQLGFESDEGVTFETEPIEWNKINGEDILEITGGEHHTLILFKNGNIYGAGKNDDGQLGKLDENTEKLGTFQKLAHLPKISEIFASSHFSYALDENKDNYYTWGFGYSWVLGNGKEDSVYEAWRINNEKVFKGFFPDRLALGTSFVAYVSKCTGDLEVLLGNCKRTVRKRRYKKKAVSIRKRRKLKTLD